MSVTRGGYILRGETDSHPGSLTAASLLHTLFSAYFIANVSNFQALVTGAVETSHAAIRYFHTEGRALAIKDLHSNNIGTPINIHTCSHYSVLF